MINHEIVNETELFSFTKAGKYHFQGFVGLYGVPEFHQDTTEGEFTQLAMILHGLEEQEARAAAHSYVQFMLDPTSREVNGREYLTKILHGRLPEDTLKLLLKPFSQPIDVENEDDVNGIAKYLSHVFGQRKIDEREFVPVSKKAITAIQRFGEFLMLPFDARQPYKPNEYQDSFVEYYGELHKVLQRHWRDL